MSKKDEKRSGEAIQGKTIAERIEEAAVEVSKLKATAKAFGIDLRETTKRETPLATQIVVKAMESQENAIKDMKGKTQELQREVKEATQNTSEIQLQLLTDMVKRLEAAQKRAGEAETAGPKDAFTHYREIKSEVELFMRTLRPQGMSDATQIKIKELELQQQRELSRAEADNCRSKQLFDMVMVLGRDYMELKRVERQSREAFRAETIQGLSDLVAAIGEALKGKKK